MTFLLDENLALSYAEAMSCNQLPSIITFRVIQFSKEINAVIVFV